MAAHWLLEIGQAMKLQRMLRSPVAPRVQTVVPPSEIHVAKAAGQEVPEDYP
jgi:hypothetical protein